MEIKEKEFILCAAVWYKDGKHHDDQPDNIDQGFVVCGRRHSSCYAIIKAFTGAHHSSSTKEETIEEARAAQGFVTSTNRFVDRREAFKIAKYNNQIQYGLECFDDEEDNLLISENLY